MQLGVPEVIFTKMTFQHYWKVKHNEKNEYLILLYTQFEFFMLWFNEEEAKTKHALSNWSKGTKPCIPKTTNQTQKNARSLTEHNLRISCRKKLNLADVYSKKFSIIFSNLLWLIAKVNSGEENYLHDFWAAKLVNSKKFLH